MLVRYSNLEKATHFQGEIRFIWIISKRRISDVVICNEVGGDGPPGSTALGVLNSFKPPSSCECTSLKTEFKMNPIGQSLLWRNLKIHLYITLQRACLRDEDVWIISVVLTFWMSFSLFQLFFNQDKSFLVLKTFKNTSFWRNYQRDINWHICLASGHTKWPN